MVSIARRNLFAEKGRLAISVGGVAFAVLLVLVLWGLYQGWSVALTAYIDSIPVDLWVVQGSSRADMFHSVSLLPRHSQESLEALPGVEEVHPFLGRSVAFPWRGKEVTTYLVGYDPAWGMAGPRKVIQGKEQPGPGEIIIDQVFAKNKSIAIGDRLPIGGRELGVVGIAQGGNMFLYQLSFITQEEAQGLLGMKDFTNYFLIHLREPSEKAKVTEAIEATLPGVRVLSREEFSRSNRELVSETFLPIILVLVLIGFAVGIVVIGLTLYTATMEKAREYGVLKAMGASNGRLYRIVFEQALISGVLGYLVGVVLALGVTRLAEGVVPNFATRLGPWDLLGIFGLALLMSLAASYFPVSRLVRLDPALVFRY